MKYNFVGAIEQMTVHGRVMRIEGTNTDVFYTDTYAYFAPDDCVVSTGNNYIIYDEPDKGNEIKYIQTTIEFLKQMFQDKEWTIREM